MKRTFGLLLLTTLLVAPLAAQAMCYTIFDRKSDVLYRSDAPPFDLSLPTSVGITDSRFTGGYLVIIPVNDECYPYGVLDRSTNQDVFEPKNYYKRLRGKE